MSTDLFAKRVREVRAMRGMSQEEVGRAMKMPSSQVAVAHFEAGRRRPSLKNLIALCRALNCSADYLLGLDERIKPEAVEVSIGDRKYKLIPRP